MHVQDYKTIGFWDLAIGSKKALLTVHASVYGNWSADERLGAACKRVNDLTHYHSRLKTAKRVSSRPNFHSGALFRAQCSAPLGP